MVSLENAELRLKQFLPTNIYQRIGDINRTHINPCARANQLLALLEDIDPGTYMHSMRVARGSVQVAQKLGCPKKFLSKIFVLGAQHDIGKFAMQDVTQSTLELTEQERIDLLPKHCIAGALIALNANMPLSHRVVNIAHHLETRGYPSFKQIAAVQCFERAHLDIMRGFYTQLEGDRRINEVTFNREGVMYYMGQKIEETAENTDLQELIFGLYAAPIVTSVDGPDAVIYPRPHSLGLLATTPEMRAEIIRKDLQTSSLPSSLLRVVGGWLPTAHETLVIKSDFEQSPALMTA